MTVAPETVTDAVAWLNEHGYDEDLQVCGRGLTRAGQPSAHPAATAVVDHTFRFEGPTDPGDEAIVLGVRLPQWGVRGVVVAAYGPDVDPDEAAVLLALTRPRR